MDIISIRNPFIDNEAIEDISEEIEDDPEIETLNDLLDDTSLSGDADVGDPLPYLRYINDDVAEREAEGNSDDETDNAESDGANDCEEPETPVGLDKPSFAERYSYKESHTSLVTTAPHIWMVSCIEGKEYSALVSLMHLMRSEQGPTLYSATLREDIPGEIFLETPWDNRPGPIINLLYKIEAIRNAYPFEPISLKRVPPLCTLELFSGSRQPDLEVIGTWVRFKFGKRMRNERPYHNEVGLIINVRYPNVDVLFVPLIPRTSLKHTSFHLLNKSDVLRMLYDPAELNDDARLSISAHYSHEHGLRIRRVRVRNLITVEERPVTQSEVLCFILSNHPAVRKHFPRVKEWIFESGDRVAKWWHREVTGTVIAVEENGVLVRTDLQNEEMWGWGLIKLWNQAEHVMAFDGFMGFVEEVYGDWIHVSPGEFDGFSNPTRQRDIHNNSARKRTPDVILHNTPALQDASLLEAEPSNDEENWERQITLPWKGMAAIVTHGPSKGEHVVIDLIPGCSTESGYKVVVQSCIVHKPVQSTVDYDDVVSKETGRPLHLSANSRGWILKFPDGYRHRHQYSKYEPPAPFIFPPSNPPRETTPVPPETPLRHNRSNCHPSQRWLWDLDTIGLIFEVDIVRDAKKKRIKLIVDEELDANLFGYKVMYHEVRRKKVYLDAEAEIVPIAPTMLSRRPFFVYNDDDAADDDRGEVGGCYAKIGFMNGRMFCVAVDMRKCTVEDMKTTYLVGLNRCCMLHISGKRNEENLMLQLEPTRILYST